MLLTMTLWFVVGVSAVLAFNAGLSWQIALFCLAALTILFGTVACVLGSVLLHGIGAAPAVRWLRPKK